MCAAGGVLLMIILIFGWSRPGEGGCPRGWIYYKPDESCLKGNMRGYYWATQRTKCQDMKGGLAVIADWAKMNFIIDNFPVKSYWMGGHDMDADGTFVLLNGTVVKSDKPGVGNFTTYGYTRKKLCLAMSLYIKAFEYKKCTNYRFGLCEIFLKKTVHTDSTTCTLENCPCQREAWTAYKPGLKYIKPNHVLATYADSVRICEKLGGQLLTVLDEDKHSFVKGISRSWSPTGAPYWIGLRLEQQQWIWTIDNKTSPLTFGHWFTDNWHERTCAVVVWNYAGYLRQWACQLKQYHVCETKHPCSAQPILTVDGVQVKPQGNIFVTKSDLAQSVKVKCSAKGYIPSINTTTFICFGMTESKTGTMEVNETIVVDDTWHDKRCTCRVILNDGKNKQESFRINYLIPPRRKDKEELIFEVYIGHDLNAEIEIIANPKPRLVSVKSVGSSDVLSEYKYTITPGEESRQHVLTLTFMAVLEINTGNYSLEMENGFQETLVSYIFIRAIKLEPIEEESQLSMTVLIMLAVLWASLMIFSLSGDKESDDQEQEGDSINDENNELLLLPAVSVQQNPMSISGDKNKHDSGSCEPMNNAETAL